MGISPSELLIVLIVVVVFAGIFKIGYFNRKPDDDERK